MIRFLTESEELNNKYNSTNDIMEKINILKSFGSEIPNIDKKVWDDFVESNPSQLLLEVDKYGFSIDNPFIQFVINYYNRNKNLTPFIGDDSKYNVLHELVVKGIIDSKQLAFKAHNDREGDLQIEFLLNPSLWENDNKNIQWLVKLWIWFSDTYDVFEHINNKYILDIFFPGADRAYRNDGDLKKQKSDIKPTFRDVKRLKIATFFTDMVDRIYKLKNEDLDESQIKKLQDEIKMLDTDHWMVSGKLNSPTFIGEQTKQFSEYTQESYKDATNGRYQKRDATNNQIENNVKSKVEPSKYLSNKEINSINYLLLHDRDLISNLQKTAKNLNPNEWDQLIKLLSKGQLNFIKGDFNS